MKTFFDFKKTIGLVLLLLHLKKLQKVFSSRLMLFTTTSGCAESMIHLIRLVKFINKALLIFSLNIKISGNIDGEKKWPLGSRKGVIYDLDVVWFGINAHTLYKVCHNEFDSIDEDIACFTLGYIGGMNSKTISQRHWQRHTIESGSYISHDLIPFLMNDVKCASSEENFLDCEYRRASSDRKFCYRHESLLLTCKMSEF